MTDNDYIAEYVKEYYPNILGVHYYFWRFGKSLKNVFEDFAKMFKRKQEEQDERVECSESESIQGGNK